MKLNVSDVSRANRVSVYKALLRGGAISRLDISQQLAISLPTVTKTIKSLIAAGLAVDTGTKASTGGRKAMVTEPLPLARIALGVDITKNHIGFAAVNLAGDVLAHVRLPKKFAHTPDYFEEISAMALDFLRSSGLDPAVCLGSGVALPGIVSREGDSLLSSHVLSLKGPLTLPLSLLPQPCRLFNDASAACLAEIWGQPEEAGFIFLCLSNTVGGALVRHGRMLDGDNQRSAEFGHLTVNPDGPLCYCGQPGHYDVYGSALNLAVYGGGRLENFFQALDSGDAEAARLFNVYLRYLAHMVCNLRMIADVDVVLGGYVGSQLAPYLEQLRARVAACDPFASPPDYLRLCRRKFESSAVGAALYHIDQFIENV